MKTIPILLTLCLLIRVSAQEPTPAPKKDPFAGFGGTSLDRKQPGKPPAGGLPRNTLVPPVIPPPAPLTVTPSTSAANSDGLKLTPHWDSPTGLARGGPLQQRKELRALLTGFAEPGRDTSPHPEKRIYRQVTYLLPFAQARAQLGLGGSMKSGGKSPVVGFPDGGLTFEAFTQDSGRSFEVRLLQDIASQVVAVEFVANNPNSLPPPPDPLPPDRMRDLRGKTYDFVPEGITATGKTYAQVSWDVGDYVLISTRGGPKSADLYIPKPMVSFILYSLEMPAGH